MNPTLRHTTPRWIMGVLAGVAVALAVGTATGHWDTALLAGWNAGLIAYLGLILWMMEHTSAERTQALARAGKPATAVTLSVVIVTSIVGLLGAMVLSSRTSGRGDLAQTVHVANGVVAVFASWALIHTEFALYYARAYYHTTAAPPDAQPSAERSGAGQSSNRGLLFPNAVIVGYWDFMYYSFTIAMCYATSDVTVTSTHMRRATLLHAILSFLFVLTIFSFVVNAIGAMI